MNTENLNMTPEEQEQYNQFLEQFMKSIDPTDYMPPSIREVARMDMDTLKTEYEMVQAKTSERSSTQRKLITERYEYELTKEKPAEDGQE
jgi:hypothetical protein